jgi:hypothetical protein
MLAQRVKDDVLPLLNLRTDRLHVYRLCEACWLRSEPLLVAVANIANGLRSQRNHAGNPGCADTFGQLLEGQSTEYDSNLLYAAGEQAGECPLIGGDFNTQRMTAHNHSMGQNNST